MKKFFWLAVVCVGLLPGSLSATAIQAIPTIQFQVTNLGSNSYRYNYFLSGATIQANQVVDIQFDPAKYSNLINPVAGSGFTAFVLQPNNPPGTVGDYKALALVNNPALTGPFSVDFSFIGAGVPGSQPFLLSQYDQNGMFVSNIGSGVTQPFSQTGVPEPASFSLGCIAALMGGTMLIARRGSGRTTQENSK